MFRLPGKFRRDRFGTRLGGCALRYPGTLKRERGNDLDHPCFANACSECRFYLPRTRNGSAFQLAPDVVFLHARRANNISLQRSNLFLPLIAFCGQLARRRQSMPPRFPLRRPYSITSSAIARMPGGMVRPSALAVLRFMTSSNFADCWTGKSPGLAPLRILPAKIPIWRYPSGT